MTDKRKLVHTASLFLLPLVVAWFGWGIVSALLAVLLMLTWRWLISLSTFVWPEKVPDVVLDTISASHFVEKVRWNMDIAGIEYTERTTAGTFGAYFLGRTVPRLRFRTGAVRSEIGNSREILRYLWGAYRTSQAADVDHLEPTPGRDELEARLDRHGANLQVWVYHHILEDRELALHAWGVDSPSVPAWQRWLMRPLFPLQSWLIRRSFRITPKNYEKACKHIEELLADMNETLADGRQSILGGEALNYTDYAFAAMTGIWLMPAGYGGGKAEHVRIERSQATNPMRADIERWVDAYPHAVGWVQRMYAERRLPAASKLSNAPGNPARTSSSNSTATTEKVTP